MTQEGAGASFMEAYNSVDPTNIPDAPDFYYPPDGDYNVRINKLDEHVLKGRDGKKDLALGYFEYEIIDGEEAGKTFRSDYMWPPTGSPERAEQEKRSASILKKKLSMIFDRPIDKDFDFGTAMKTLRDSLQQGAEITLRINCRTSNYTNNKGEKATRHYENYRAVLGFQTP